MISPSLTQPKVARDSVWKRLFAYRETWVALALLAFFGLGSLLRPDFFPTSSNLANILREMSQLGLIALGVSFVIVNGDLDLSVGSVFGVATLTVTQLVYFYAWSPWTAALAALLVGLLFGVVNGLLVTRLRLPAFIVTLAMMFIARGLTLAVSASQRFSLNSDSTGFYALGQPGFLGINNQVFVLIVMLALLGILMWRTPFGYRVYASGGNRNAATVSGINTNIVRLQSFMISSFCAALAGVLAVAFTPSFSPDAGQGLELDAVAAAVVGGISLFGGRGSTLGAVLGVGFLITIRKILIVGITLGGGDLWRLPQTATPAFIGGFILLAVIIDVWVREEQLLARLLARLQGRFMPARPTGTASETLGTKGRAIESLPPPGFRGLLVRVFGSREAGGVLIFAVVFLVGTFLRTDFFPSLANVSIAIQEQVFQIAIIALGMTFVIVNGDIDLSVGSTLSLSGGCVFSDDAGGCKSLDRRHSSNSLWACRRRSQRLPFNQRQAPTVYCHAWHVATRQRAGFDHRCWTRATTDRFCPLELLHNFWRSKSACAWRSPDRDL